MTARELITAALRQLGELSPGQSPNPEEEAAGLEMLNTILENWENQRRKVYIIDNLQFPIIDSKGVYTMGPGGEFDTYRPVKIQAANVVLTETSAAEGLAYPLELVPSKVYENINEKTLKARRPLQLYNDNDFPLIRLYLWPVPIVDGLVSRLNETAESKE